MQVDDIRAFVPSKNYSVSKSFYHALGFEMDYVSEDLTLFTNGECSFFLQRFYNQTFANNLMLQLSVLDIAHAYATLSNLTGFDIRFEPIKEEPWGKVMSLWGPSGELWQITEFTATSTNCIK